MNYTPHIVSDERKLVKQIIHDFDNDSETGVTERNTCGMYTCECVLCYIKMWYDKYLDFCVICHEYHGSKYQSCSYCRVVIFPQESLQNWCLKNLCVVLLHKCLKF